ncbi:phospholipase C [Ameyamaea chiangmaiensis NBRC 103196]|uniref:phosphocholine-specific phospholipase C n=1 Tax=Ameyamaea chiangmaiensis TaxID=442969 RepID=UPI002156945A|nr:phospholipase C [Ameyamaea chiangmaiensis NBRC 103196]
MSVNPSSRRAFLRFMAAAAATASGVVPENVRRALAVPAHRVTGTIMDVEHVVILMQENRSFDHYFGTLRGVRGYGDPRAAPLPHGDTVFAQPNPKGGTVLPFRLNTQTTSAECLPSLDHSWKGTQTEWNNWDVWIKHKTAMTMGYFTRNDTPYYHALADAFTICDAYHCSIFGPTNPNRLYFFSGTSGLAVDDFGRQVTINVDDGNVTADMALDHPAFPGFTWQTYGDALMAHGVDWKVYQERDNFTDNPLASFAQFRNLDPNSARYRAARAIVPGSTPATMENSEARYLLAAFEHDVRHGTLPPVSWIVPPQALSEHPDAPPGYGEFLVSRIMDIFVRHPEVWAKTVFILNYDENDGFFDHVPPPVPALDPAQGVSTVATTGEDFHGVPVGLGPRVPMIVISPWSTGGWVNSELFDHTSVLRFLEKRFGVPAPHVTPWRRAVTGDLTSAFDFTHKAASFPASLPKTDTVLADTRRSCTLMPPTLPVTQERPVQEPGQRPARPLAYTLRAALEPAGTGGRVTLDNAGALGATFLVFNGQPTGPLHVTLATHTATTLPLGDDRGQVHGPNGFWCSLTTGGHAHWPRIATDIDAASGRLLIALHPTSEHTCALTLTQHAAYGGESRAITLTPGAVQTVAWDLASSDHWYDVSVTSSDMPGFVVRLAGHVETGRASRSDPLLGEPMA